MDIQISEQLPGQVLEQEGPDKYPDHDAQRNGGSEADAQVGRRFPVDCKFGADSSDDWRHVVVF